MNINQTLFGQMITFGLFVWVTMKYIWPPITKAMETRQQKIADGLANAEAADKKLAQAVQESEKIIQTGRQKASECLQQAKQEANAMINTAKQAQSQLKQKAELALQQQKRRLQQQLKQEASDQIIDLALSMAEKILGEKLDKVANQTLIKRLMHEDCIE